MYGQCDAQSLGEAGEFVRPPTVTQRDRDRDRLRVAADGQVAGIPDKVPEGVLRTDLVEDQGQERARPGERRGAFGEEPKEVGAERTAPAFDVSDVLLPERLETPTIRFA